ncbi:MAG: P-loop containing nucleoside triphosphate hydrolase protein [Benniella sp.]|nr:MAG: P-loop containing nucleoside triphosphate hydrolase protein [Benniella sp.]
MGLKLELLGSIRKYGLQKPSKLQQDTLPLLIGGRDVVMEAPVNSGKTTTVCISALQKVDIYNPQCQVLILNPSLEITLQTMKVTLALGSHSIHCHVCTDQAHLREDRMRLEKGSHIVVGTPSCVQGVIDHGVLMTNGIRMVFFDRVDYMISEGSKDIIENILQAIPRNTQVVFLLSKTSTQLEDLTTKFMCNPAWISHGTEEPDLDDSKTLAGSAHYRSDNKISEPNQNETDNQDEIDDNQDGVVGNQEEIDHNQDKIDDKHHKILESFDGMNLKPEVLRDITAYDLENLSTVLLEAMPLILKGQDVIVEAQPGPDKIATISIPILQKLDTSIKQCQALVLVPIHELASEIQAAILAPGTLMNIQSHISISGNSIQDDVNALRNGAQIVVGTLRRVLHMINRGILRTDYIKMFVMDGMLENQSMDGMPAKQSMDAIEVIVQQLPPSVQLVFFITRMTKGVREITSRLIREPIHVKTKGITGISKLMLRPTRVDSKCKTSEPLERVFHFYVAAETESKFDTLCNLCDKIAATHIVVFCNSTPMVSFLRNMLTARNYAVEGIRDRAQAGGVLKGFSLGSFRVLVSKGKSLNGISVREASLIINFEMPFNIKRYKSQVGHAGAERNKGVVINILTSKERARMKMWEEIHLIAVQEMSVDDPAESK